MINNRWNERMDLHDGRRSRTRKSFSHEDHTFTTHTDWDKEDRTAADRRINREMIEWKKGVLDSQYGEDEGHKNK